MPADSTSCVCVFETRSIGSISNTSGLGVVAFAQKHFSQVYISSATRGKRNSGELERNSNRIYQARLTCLTWLRKCAKERGDECEAEKYTKERTAMKKEAGLKSKEKIQRAESVKLQHKLVDCRSFSQAICPRR